MSNIKEEIIKLKKEKNAVILAHCYENIEVDEVADYVGDSLYLSQIAAKTDADIIVFCGVYFMAETAKILSPEKKVLLPNISAGCAMADMLSAQQLKEFKAQYPNVPVVCYVNSTAEVKSLSDISCTSANAIKIVKSLNSKEVLFVPDKGLGGYVNSQLEDVNVTSFEGYCPVHYEVRKEEIQDMKLKYPNAMVLVHPESHIDVVAQADFVGSTSGIMKAVKESDKKQFIIVTEIGVTERLQRDYPDREFYAGSPKSVCKDMKLITLEDILKSLQTLEPEVIVEEEISKKAYECINKMLKVS